MDAAPQGEASIARLATLIRIREHISVQKEADPHFGVFARRMAFDMLENAELASSAREFLDALNDFDRCLLEGDTLRMSVARQRCLVAITLIDSKLRGSTH